MATTRPKVVLLRLYKTPWDDDGYGDDEDDDIYGDDEDDRDTTIDKIKSQADVEEIVDVAAANALFDGSERLAVYIMDNALSQQESEGLRAKAVAFVRTGGTIIFGGSMSGCTDLDHFKTLFSAFALPWDAGDYFRSNFDVNPAMLGVSHAGLTPVYSMKVVHLVNVAKSDALYLPSATSPIQSMSTMIGPAPTNYPSDPHGASNTSWMAMMLAGNLPIDPSNPGVFQTGVQPVVFTPMPVDDFSQTPVALATVGEGKVGYIGDVNTEKETEQVVLAMLGLN